MSKKNFDSLKKIIFKLKSAEEKTFERYMSAFAPSTKKNTVLILFDFITKNPEKNYEETFTYFHKEQSKKRSFDKNISRLKTKLIDTLCIEVNTNRKGTYSKISNAEFKVNRLTLAGDVLLGRGLETEAIKLYDDAITLCEKYELYEDLSRVLHTKQLIAGLLSKDIYAEDFEKQIKQTEKCKKAKHRAQYLYYQFFSKEDFKGIPNGKVGFLTETLAELQKYLKETGSNYIRFFVYYLLIEYYHALRDYEKAEIVTLKLVDVVKKPSVHSEKRYANVLDTTAENYIFLLDFDKVIHYANEALKHYQIMSFDYLTALENKFFGYFYSKQVENARKTIINLINEEHLKTIPFRHNKAVFYHSALEFIDRNYKTSYQLLWDTKEIESDTEGWSTWIRILTILNYIELSMLDEADFKIENFKKFIQRNKDKAEFRERDLLIMKILGELERSNFNFQKVLNEHADWFEKLESTDEDYVWLVKSPEMIVFHQWFKAKATNKDYKPDYQSIKPISTLHDQGFTLADEVLSPE